MSSMYSRGGFEPRFHIARRDGKPCHPLARYMVMNAGVDETGKPLDPHARFAIRAYAVSVAQENPTLSADLIRMLDEGWPGELSQHGG